MNLNNLKINEIAIIKNINSKIKNTLIKNGITKGKKIIPILNNLSNNMRAYKVDNTLISIRNDDAKKIKVEK